MGAMDLLVSGLVSFLLAIGLGIYRIRCTTLEIRVGIQATPAIWKSKVFQVVSWIIVAALSIWSAFISVAVANIFLPKLIAYFFFGAILVIRWGISGMIALAWVKRTSPEALQHLSQAQDLSEFFDEDPEGEPAIKLGTHDTPPARGDRPDT